MSSGDRIVAEVERVLPTDIKTNRNLSIQLVLGLGACIQRENEGIVRMEIEEEEKKMGQTQMGSWVWSPGLSGLVQKEKYCKIVCFLSS
jgi:hypothetical protein